MTKLVQANTIACSSSAMLEQHNSTRSTRSSRLARQSRTCRVETSQVEFGSYSANDVTASTQITFNVSATTFLQILTSQSPDMAINLLWKEEHWNISTYSSL